MFTLNEYHRDISMNQLIEDVQAVAEKSSVPLTRRIYDEHGKFSSTTLIRRFGSWAKTIETAGLTKSRNSQISNQQLFDNLRDVWMKLGRQPAYGEMAAPLSKFHVKSYEVRFKTWREALEAFVTSVRNDESSHEKPELRRRTPRQPNLRLRFLVMRRDGFRCRNCGKSPAINPGVQLHVDHKKAWSCGGETVLENLQTLCEDCNQGKGILAAEMEEA